VAALDLGRALILAGESQQAREPLLQAVTLASCSEHWVAARERGRFWRRPQISVGDLERAEAWIRDALEVATR